MHDYSINTNERFWVNVIIIGFSLFLSFSFFRVIVFYNIQIPWYLETPSFLGFLSILNIFYSKYLWRKSIGKFRLSSIPDLNGTWEGVINSSYDKFSSTIPCTLVIKQEYSKLLFCLKTENSNSKSLSCSMVYQEGINPEISYLYSNEPTKFSDKELHIHVGCTKLILEDKKTIIGNYFSNPDRMSFGNISLHKTG